MGELVRTLCRVCLTGCGLAAGAPSKCHGRASVRMPSRRGVALRLRLGRAGFAAAGFGHAPLCCGKAGSADLVPESHAGCRAACSDSSFCALSPHVCHSHLIPCSLQFRVCFSPGRANAVQQDWQGMFASCPRLLVLFPSQVPRHTTLAHRAASAAAAASPRLGAPEPGRGRHLAGGERADTARRTWPEPGLSPEPSQEPPGPDPGHPRSGRIRVANHGAFARDPAAPKRRSGGRGTGRTQRA